MQSGLLVRWKRQRARGNAGHGQAANFQGHARTPVNTGVCPWSAKSAERGAPVGQITRQHFSLRNFSVKNGLWIVVLARRCAKMREAFFGLKTDFKNMP
jgi:hypothetical protein